MSHLKDQYALIGTELLGWLRGATLGTLIIDIEALKKRERKKGAKDIVLSFEKAANWIAQCDKLLLEAKLKDREEEKNMPKFITEKETSEPTIGVRVRADEAGNVNIQLRGASDKWVMVAYLSHDSGGLSRVVCSQPEQDSLPGVPFTEGGLIGPQP